MALRPGGVMADRIGIPDPDLHALAGGRTVVAFVPRHAVDLNDELELEPTGPRAPGEVSAAFQDLVDAGPPPWSLVGLVVGLQPAASLAAGGEHHILAAVPEGDVAILRIFSDTGPALPDHEFEDQRRAVEAMFT